MTLSFYDPRWFFQENFSWMLIVVYSQLFVVIFLLIRFPIKPKLPERPSPRDLYERKQWPLLFTLWLTTRIVMCSTWVISVLYLIHLVWVWLLVDLDELLGDRLMWRFSTDFRRRSFVAFSPIFLTCMLPWITWKVSREGR